MKEIVEFRIVRKYAHLIVAPNEGRDLGGIQVIEIDKKDPRYEQMRLLSKEIKRIKNESLFFGWQIKRIYSQKELNESKLFHVTCKKTFEPYGEECGTIYDDSVACPLCKANSVQTNELHLRKSSIPQKDIARTIVGEIIVSETFKNAIEKWVLKGIYLAPVLSKTKVLDYYQPFANSPKVELSEKTVAGCDLFDFTEVSNGGTYELPDGSTFKMEKEYYKCPNGHTIGLNLLSLPYVLESEELYKYDFFVTRQMIGVRRGILRPEPLYLCSPKFRKMVIEEKLTGFKFDIVHIVENKKV